MWPNAILDEFELGTKPASLLLLEQQWGAERTYRALAKATQGAE